MEKQTNQNKTTHIRVWKTDHERLLSIRESMGFRSVAWIIHRFLEKQAKNLATVESVVHKRVPVVLTGRPLSGKTFFVKRELLPHLNGKPVLVIDSWNEYEELHNMGYDLYSLDFSDFDEHVRFVPNTQTRVAETEVENIFAHLDMKRKQMLNWIIIVEEAHSYKDIPAFNRFLYGSRHIVQKMIAVTPQTDAFKGLVRLSILPSRKS